MQFAFDFATYIAPADYLRGERKFVDMSTTWAHAQAGVPYVQHNHRTYAKSSKGHNAYISALDIRTGQLLWRTQLLVGNASSFLVEGGAIIAGYGFTNEKDYLYVK